MWRRITPAYDIPIALVPWVDGLKRAIPDLQMRDFLIGNSTKVHPSSSWIRRVIAVADKLIFDFLVDDHDTQGTQNWKADIQGRLLHWDTGLGWRDGPFPRTNCFEVLCGTKQWKGVGHHDPNPEYCDKICKFPTATIEMLQEFKNQPNPKLRLSYLLKESLKSDPLYPVFDLGLWKYYSYDKKGNRSGSNIVRLKSLEEFFLGMDKRIDRLLDQVAHCEEKIGSENVYLSE